MQTSRGIKTVRRLLGIPVGGIELRRDDITKLEKKTTMQSQSGSKHVIYYNVCAVDGSGKQHDIALGFRGESFELEERRLAIGRSRTLAPSRVASVKRMPSSTRARANWTIRMAFLVVSPMVVSSPIWK